MHTIFARHKVAECIEVIESTQSPIDKLRFVAPHMYEEAVREIALAVMEYVVPCWQDSDMWKHFAHVIRGLTDFDSDCSDEPVHLIYTQPDSPREEGAGMQWLMGPPDTAQSLAVSAFVAGLPSRDILESFHRDGSLDQLHGWCYNLAAIHEQALCDWPDFLDASERSEIQGMVLSWAVAAIRALGEGEIPYRRFRERFPTSARMADMQREYAKYSDLARKRGDVKFALYDRMYETSGVGPEYAFSQELEEASEQDEHQDKPRFRGVPLDMVCYDEIDPPLTEDQTFRAATEIIKCLGVPRHIIADMAPPVEEELNLRGIPLAKVLDALFDYGLFDLLGENVGMEFYNMLSVYADEEEHERDNQS